MMSAKSLAFLAPSPPCLHLDPIYTIEINPTLKHPLSHDPLPPLMRTSYLEAPVVNSNWLS